MPRRSREKDNYGVYHIKQQSSGVLKLFANEGDRREFLSILSQTAEKNNFRLLSYCVAEADEYHLILDANGCDISKVMKEINIRYSIHKECQGQLFRDRFQSRLLTSSFTGEEDPKVPLFFASPAQYHSCRNFQEAWGSFVQVEEAKGQRAPLPEEAVFQRGCRERIATMEEAQDELSAKARELNMSLAQILRDKPLRNALIQRLKACSTLSLKEIGQVFGGLSESSVSKLLNAGRQRSES